MFGLFEYRGDSLVPGLEFLVWTKWEKLMGRIRVGLGALKGVGFCELYRISFYGLIVQIQ